MQGAILEGMCSALLPANLLFYLAKSWLNLSDINKNVHPDTLHEVKPMQINFITMTSIESQADTDLISAVLQRIRQT